MADGYHHLTYGSRCQIYALKKSGASTRGVARALEVSAGLSAGFYFATPYHSWERGLNEHANGLVRQYFPKATDFTGVGEARGRQVQDLLNGRPRRALGYRTPAEVFGEARVDAGVTARRRRRRKRVPGGAMLRSNSGEKSPP